MTKPSMAGFQMPPIATLVFFALLAAMTVIAPRASIGAFIGSAIISILYLWRSGTPFLDSKKRSIIFTALLALLGYAVINASWAVDVGEAYDKVALFLLVIAGSYVSARVIETGRTEDLRLVAHGLAIGIGVAALFLLIEVLTNQFLLKTFYNLAPWARPEGTKHVQVRGGQVTEIRFSDLNRAVAFLAFALWPTALMITSFCEGRRLKVLLSVLFIAAIVVIFPSNHESSKAAVLAGAVIFILAWWRTALAWWLTAVSWVAVFVLVIPIAFLAHNMGLHKVDALRYSNQGRIIIWYETAKKTLETPILGIGIRSTKALDRIAKKNNTVQHIPGEAYTRHIDRHSHNAYLQTWLELGLIGVLLVAAFGVAILRRIAKEPEDLQKFALATFVSIATVAAFSWGIWQGWYLFGIALTALTVALANRVANDTSRPS